MIFEIHTASLDGERDWIDKFDIPVDNPKEFARGYCRGINKVSRIKRKVVEVLTPNPSNEVEL